MVATATSHDAALTFLLIGTAAIWATCIYPFTAGQGGAPAPPPPPGVPRWFVEDLDSALIDDVPLEEDPPEPPEPEEGLEKAEAVLGNINHAEAEDLSFSTRLQQAFKGTPETVASDISAPIVDDKESAAMREYRLLEAAHLRVSFGADKSQRFEVESSLANMKRDLGQGAAAMRLYDKAREHATTPEQQVTVLSDVAETHLREGDVDASLETLRGAEAILEASKLDRAVVSDPVQAQLKERLGRAYHASTDAWDFGEARERQAMGYYREAFQLSEPETPQAAAVQQQIERLRAGGGPAAAAKRTLRGERLPPPAREAAELRAKPLPERVRSLMRELLPQRAEAEVLKALETLAGTAANRQELPAVLNLLGEVRRGQECYDSAAQSYALALRMALLAGDTATANDAYLGLSYCQPALHGSGRSSDAVAIYDGAVKAAQDAGISAENPNRISMERRLRVNAYPQVESPPMRLQCRIDGGDKLPNIVKALLLPEGER